MLTENDAHEVWRARPWLSTPRICLAEDDDAFRGLLAEALDALGYEVVQAAHGAELLRLLEASRRGHGKSFDLVITDIRMPLSDGLSAVEALRRHDWALPVIVMSAYLDLDSTAEALRLGAVSVLSKPFELSRLQREVSRLLDSA